MGMFTNGTLFDVRDLFETLVDNMTWVRISIDAGTKQTYNGIRVARNKQDWDKMVSNLQKLIEVNKSKGNKIDIGVGYVISPDTYSEIVEFAEFFKDYDLSYCQYKPEIIIREDGGVQRDRDFWLNKVEPLLTQAKSILGDKFQINGYKFNDLENNIETYGRNYKKCLGSQLSPCIGADGHVYVCTNHRGWKQYSYGNLYDDSFKSIWGNLQKRKEVMSLIEDVECFENCTKLCKPHESNKAMWDIQQGLENNTMTKETLLKEKEEVRKFLKHPEFI